MANLTGLDLMKVMVEQEKETAELYREISHNAQEGDLFFERLAEDEERHQKIYEGLVKRFERDHDLGMSEPLSDEDNAYLQALVDNDALNNKDEYLSDANNINSRMAIYDLAIRLEQDTVSFVTELDRLYHDILPEDFNIIIREEKQHLAQVRQRKLDYGIAGRGM